MQSNNTVTDKTRIYTFAGCTDDVVNCDCCGRMNLKRTIVLQPTDGSDFVFFGVVCAAKALTWATKTEKLTSGQIVKHAEAAERQRRIEDWKRRKAEHPATVQIAELIKPFEGMEFRERIHNPAWIAIKDQVDALYEQLKEVTY